VWRGAARCGARRAGACVSRERVFSPRLHVCAHLRAAVARRRRRCCPGTPLWSVATAARRGFRVCAAGPRAIAVCVIRVRANSQQQLVAASDNIYFRYDREGTVGEREREGGRDRRERDGRSSVPDCRNAICVVSVDARPGQPARAGKMDRGKAVYLQEQWQSFARLCDYV